MIRRSEVRSWRSIGRFCFLLSVICLLYSLTGCEAFKRKFIPKKKPQPRRLALYEEKEYAKEPSGELYKKHFLFWKSWQGELAEALGAGNHLKEISCAESAVVELGIAKSLLVDDKKRELEAELAKLAQIRDEIKEGELSFASASRLKRDVERLKTRIEKRFSYSKVKDYIK